MSHLTESEKLMIGIREVFTTESLQSHGLEVVLREFTAYGLAEMREFGMEATAKATLSSQITSVRGCAVLAPLTRWEKILSRLHIRFQKRYGLEIGHHQQMIDEELRLQILMQIYHWEYEGRKCSKIMFSREAYMEARMEPGPDSWASLDLRGTIPTIYGLEIYVSPYLLGDVSLVC